ncbi:hypothetical protein BDN72DRAFT_851670, partial [Pluteus cervinus]
KLDKLIIDQTETDPEFFAPLVQGISVIDLERFLATLFPTEYGQYDATSFDEWASILKVAHHWQFESIVKLALEKIEPVSSPVDKVVLGKTYNIPEWATEARVILCRREEPITLEEASRMGMEEVVSISQTRHHIRSSEIRSGMQDSTIRSLLSGEQHDERLDRVAEIVPLPDVSQVAHSDSTITSGQSTDAAPEDRKDPRICRALELREQLKTLKSQLAALRKPAADEWGVLQINDSHQLLLAESEEVEIQIDDLEEEYTELYQGFSSGWDSNTSLSIERTRTAESGVLSKLTACLHPSFRTPQTLTVQFPSFNTSYGIRQRPQKIALDTINRYGLKYTTDARTGEIKVTIPSILS